MSVCVVAELRPVFVYYTFMSIPRPSRKHESFAVNVPSDTFGAPADGLGKNDEPTGKTVLSCEKNVLSDVLCMR